MNIQRAHPVNDLLARLLLLVLPTLVAAWYLIDQSFRYFSVIGDYQGVISSVLPGYLGQALLVTFYLGAGMVGALIFYAFRFRFVLTAAALYLLLYLVYRSIDAVSVGEFDSFIASVQFLIFAVFFGLGWFGGWALLRFRFTSVVISLTLLLSGVYLIAKTQSTLSLMSFLRAFSPLALFSIYLVFVSEQIYNYKDKGQKFWWFLGRRIASFAVIAALLLGTVIYTMRRQIKEIVDTTGGGGKNGKSSMLKQNKDNSFDLNDYSRLSGSLGRSNDLLFCAHIDNFFPNTQVPNPLYLTAFYYTKFDTLTETFTRDAQIPNNDLFQPEPGRMPLFSTKTDTSVIRNSLGPLMRREVSVEIYNKKLSGSTFLAPSTAFFVQPVTIEKDFRGQFQSAYRAKSYVSELNSAYFVYNAPDTLIRIFQSKRFNILRQAAPYGDPNTAFMRYYTYMPSDVKFGRIRTLARQVTAQAKTPVDKVIAIRDYFLSKDESGAPLFKYTDNPGIPDLPSASKLQYFLFENHQGYCAYYAGATLFMLRALGIPSRIAVGFLTMDRSDKNKGWYWYYADQAHAWVQVYFPGYGWLDFDTTVGNSDARESPQPDQTPPMQPPKAWLAAEGKVESVDTVSKTARITIARTVFHDKEFSVSPATDKLMDLHIATVLKDSADVPLGTLKKGMDVTAVSYADAIKNLAERRESGAQLVDRLPVPTPIDEVYIRETAQQKKEKLQAPAPAKKTDYRFWLRAALVAAIVLAVLFLLSAVWIYLYYALRRKLAASGERPFWTDRLISFYLHLLGVYRDARTPLQYARTLVDPVFGTEYAAFLNVYLKQKYSGQALSGSELERTEKLGDAFFAQMRAQVPAGRRIAVFLNPFRAWAFVTGREY